MLCVRAGITCIAALILLRDAPGYRSYRTCATPDRQTSVSSFCDIYGLHARIFGKHPGVTLIVGALFGRPLWQLLCDANVGALGRLPAILLIFRWSGIFIHLWCRRIRKYKWLARRHAYATAALCIFYLAGMWLFAHWIIHVWTSDRVNPMEPLLTLIAIACACEMMWSSGKRHLFRLTGTKQ